MEFICKWCKQCVYPVTSQTCRDNLPHLQTSALNSCLYFPLYTIQVISNRFRDLEVWTLRWSALLLQAVLHSYYEAHFYHYLLIIYVQFMKFLFLFNYAVVLESQKYYSSTCTTELKSQQGRTAGNLDEPGIYKMLSFTQD